MRTLTLLTATLPLLSLVACLEFEDKEEWEEDEVGEEGEDEGDEGDGSEEDRGDRGEGGGGDGEIIALGDSVFEWHADEDASIPDVVGEQLGVPVLNRSVSGSMILGDDESIPSQYRSGSWSAVVMNGGANDLNDECGCGDCDAVLDGIVTTDGEGGALAEFVSEVTAAGVPVVFWSYYGVPDSAEFGFDRCGDTFEDYFARLQALAEAEPSFHLVDGREAVSGDELRYFDEDHAHPSVEGSRAVGEQIAATIESLGLVE